MDDRPVAVMPTERFPRAAAPVEQAPAPVVVWRPPQTERKGLWQRVIPYWGLIITYAATSIVIFLSIPKALEILGWSSLSALKYTDIFFAVVVALVLSGFLQTKYYIDLREKLTKEREEERALNQFKGTNVNILFSGIEAFLQSAAAQFPEIAVNFPQSTKETPPNFYFYVFAEREDGKFHVIAATTPKGATQNEQVWAKDEGIIPALIRFQVPIIFDRLNMKARSFNGIIDNIPLGDISVENRAKFDRDAEAFIITPVIKPQRDRREGESPTVLGTVSIHTNHSAGLEIVGGHAVGGFLERLALEVAPFLAVYSNLKRIK